MIRIESSSSRSRRTIAMPPDAVSCGGKAHPVPTKSWSTGIARPLVQLHHRAGQLDQSGTAVDLHACGALDLDVGGAAVEHDAGAALQRQLPRGRGLDG